MGKGKIILLFIAAIICAFFGGGASLSISYSPMGYVFYAHGSNMMFVMLLLMLIALLGSFKRHQAPLDIQRPAGIFRRFCAMFLDFIVYVCIAVVPIVILALVIEASHTGSFQWTVARNTKRSTDSLFGILIFLIMLGIIVLFALHVYRRQQSIGQMIMGYAVIPEGESISLIKAILRALLAYPTIILFIVSVPMALFRQDKRMWHDLVFKTYPRKWRPAD